MLLALGLPGHTEIKQNESSEKALKSRCPRRQGLKGLKTFFPTQDDFLKEHFITVKTVHRCGKCHYEDGCADLDEEGHSVSHDESCWLHEALTMCQALC